LSEPVKFALEALNKYPYACEAPYGQKAEAFRGQTRVVGRLPDVTGASDPEYLAGLLVVGDTKLPCPARGSPPPVGPLW
jgi:hypothetical protein